MSTSQSASAFEFNRPASGFPGPVSSASIFPGPVSSASIFGEPVFSASIFGGPVCENVIFGSVQPTQPPPPISPVPFAAFDGKTADGKDFSHDNPRSTGVTDSVAEEPVTPITFRDRLDYMLDSELRFIRREENKKLDSIRFEMERRRVEYEMFLKEQNKKIDETKKRMNAYIAERERELSVWIEYLDDYEKNLSIPNDAFVAIKDRVPTAYPYNKYKNTEYYKNLLKKVADVDKVTVQNNTPTGDTIYKLGESNKRVLEKRRRELKELEETYDKNQLNYVVYKSSKRRRTN